MSRYRGAVLWDIPGRGPGRWMNWACLQEPTKSPMSGTTSPMWNSRLAHKKPKRRQGLDFVWKIAPSVTRDRTPRFVALVVSKGVCLVADRTNEIAPSELLSCEDAIALTNWLNEEDHSEPYWHTPERQRLIGTWT